jgi:hypothetical protein
MVKAQAINEGFEDVTTLIPAGWFIQNNSMPLGTTNWFQGDPANHFPAQAGPENSYIAADYHNTTGDNTISDWLLMPTRTLNNGDVLTFWTSTDAGSPYPDRLQVRLSLNGSSTNVGTTATSVGDFTTLLLDINPNYEVGGYPEMFTQYTITLSGLAGPTSGRFAFRYFVEHGGSAGANSYYIGIDTVSYRPAGTAQHVADFNGNGKTDFALVRDTGGGPSGQITWFVNYDNAIDGGCDHNICQEWGLASDFFVPQDFDGDHKSDIAVWRPGAPLGPAFFIFESMTGTFRQVPFGIGTDDPTVAADYTGDGKADPAIFRGKSNSLCGNQALWSYVASSGPLNGQEVDTCFGSLTDFPVPGDFNADGKSDFCVQTSVGSQAGFYQHYGSGGPDDQNPSTYHFIGPFGLITDFVVPGDYDGDGKTDIALTRNVNGQWVWYVVPSSTENLNDPGTVWGLTSDYQVQGDYDGDGRTDIAVWRGGDPNPPFFTNDSFHVLGSSGTYIPHPFGIDFDYPPANFNTH